MSRVNEQIDLLLKQNKPKEALEYCIQNYEYDMGKLLLNIFSEQLMSDKDFYYLSYNINKNIEETKSDGKSVQIKNGIKRVGLFCSWDLSRNVSKNWNKMSEDGNGKWKSIQLVSEEPYDYVVVINCIGPEPLPAGFSKSKIILFHMEPNMERNSYFPEEWSRPNSDQFLYCGTHKLATNNIEWNISLTYNELLNRKIDKKYNGVISTILSSKYSDIGQKKRIDFTKFLEIKSDITVDVYGSNEIHKWKNYKGALPYHKKDESLFPYKYCFNAENNEIYNYCSEKLYDAILSECLIFYWGCPNVSDIVDERAIIVLELKDFEHDYNIIKNAIQNNEWEKRLPYIKAEKERILKEKQFFPRIQKIIENGI